MNFSLPASNRHMASPRCEIALPAWSRHRRVIQTKRSSPSMPHTAANSFTAPRSRPGVTRHPTRPDIRWRPAERPLAPRWAPSRWTAAGRDSADHQRVPSGQSADPFRTLVRACAANPPASERVVRLARRRRRSCRATRPIAPSRHPFKESVPLEFLEWARRPMSLFQPHADAW